MTTKQPAIDDITPAEIQAAAQRRAQGRAARERELGPKPAKPAPDIAAAVRGAARLVDQAAFARAAAARQAPAEKVRSNEQIIAAAKKFDLASIKLTPEQQKIIKMPHPDQQEFLRQFRLTLLRDATASISLASSLRVAATTAGIEHEIVKAVLTQAEIESFRGLW